jgi:hypothetical protein
VTPADRAPTDQPLFRPDDQFYRYIHPKLADEEGWPNSGAFDDDELSVDWARLTTLNEALVARPRHGVVAITKATCDELGLDVRHDPLPGNPAHCLILGRKSGAIRRRLKEQCQRLRPAMPPALT